MVQEVIMMGEKTVYLNKPHTLRFLYCRNVVYRLRVGMTLITVMR